ncbi:phosphatidylinositol-specific phospholipase C1-like protein, partial [Anoxybacillus sp. LAT_38]|nr:phosphatidylinositol-specific phospholipase C1-like protein [Anoxybacillus sp. LAT_38]
EAKINDLSRANQAFRSGAQIVSTDFYKPGNGYGTPYVVRLPGGGDMRCNPINAPKDCLLKR